jgi:hypothetical protein
MIYINNEGNLHQTLCSPCFSIRVRSKGAALLDHSLENLHPSGILHLGVDLDSAYQVHSLGFEVAENDEAAIASSHHFGAYMVSFEVHLVVSRQAYVLRWEDFIPFDH